MYKLRTQLLLINVQASIVTFLALKEQFTVTELKESWVFFSFQKENNSDPVLSLAL